MAREWKCRVEVEPTPRVVNGVSGSETFYTCGDADQVTHILSMLWRHDVEVMPLPAAFT